MEKISILYIDDSPEGALERYLESYTRDDCHIDFNVIIFDPNNGYESLINNPLVQTANIIFLDSKLFQNRNATQGKFTGEEFKIILRKYYPFIEVIVITQNGENLEMQIISKYDSRCSQSAKEYYDDLLPEHIDHAVANIKAYRSINDMLESNTNWGEVLKERVSNSLNGTVAYDELSKEDIDELINIFKQIQESTSA